MKKWKIIFVAVSILLVFRKFSSVEYTFYKAFSNYNSTHNSHIERYSSEKLPSIIETDIVRFYEDQILNIIYTGLNQKNDNLPSQNNNYIKVNVINNPNIGVTRFIPIIKPIKFYSYATYYWNTKLEKDNRIISISCSGSIKIEGDNQIYGICSGKEAKRIIENKIGAVIQDYISKEINKELSKI